MSENTYPAQLVGHDNTESVELEYIDGLPQKSFARPVGDTGKEVVWELDPDADDFVYREGGIPSADYS